MPKLRITHPVQEQVHEDHHGIEAVIKNIRLDAAVSVKLKDGTYVSGSVAPIPSEELPRFGFSPNGFPIYLVRAEERRIGDGFKRVFELVDWESVDSIWQSTLCSKPNLVQRHLGGRQ